MTVGDVMGGQMVGHLVDGQRVVGGGRVVVAGQGGPPTGAPGQVEPQLFPEHPVRPVDGGVGLEKDPEAEIYVLWSLSRVGSTC